MLFRILNARYTTRAHTLVVSNVQLDDVPEPRLRSRFLDGSLCQVVPSGAGDYRQRKSQVEDGVMMAVVKSPLVAPAQG